MFEDPTYLIQFGYNGQTIVQRAIEGGHTDGVILSPTDYEKSKNENLAEEVSDAGYYVLCDPQYYIPRTERSAAESYPYFKQKGGEEFETVVVRRKPERKELCEQIMAVQDDLEVDAYISPARYIDALSERKLNTWKDLTETFLETVENEGRDIPVFLSLPVSGAVIDDPSERNELVDIVTNYDPEGFYISVEYDRRNRHPLKGVQEVYSYLDLFLRIRQNRYEVIAGHTHQIAHLLMAMGINAFASGHYKNTKAFDVGRFAPEDGGFGRTVIYYYSDPLLNDVRVEQGLQNVYSSSFDIDRIRNNSPYETDLFAATTPEESGWKLSEASWDHYIWSCDAMTNKYQGKDIEERIETVESHLDNAEEVYAEIKSEIGELDNVEEEIYTQWPTAFSSIKDRIDKKVMRRLLN